MRTLSARNSTSSERTDTMSTMRTRLCCRSARSSRLSAMLHWGIHRRRRERVHLMYPMSCRLSTRCCRLPLLCPMCAWYVHQQPGSIVLWCLRCWFRPVCVWRHSVLHLRRGSVSVSARRFHLRGLPVGNSLCRTRTVRMHSLSRRTIRQCHRSDSLLVVSRRLSAALVGTTSL
jgi:hypothetical protein